MTNIRIYKHLYFVVNLGDGVIATSYKTVTLLDIQYDQSVRLVTVGENIIATIKMREKKNFNIAIAHLVIALISLLQFLYEICRLVHGLFFVLLPI